MTPEQERQFEIKAEKMLQGHRQAPSGRDYRAFMFRFRDEDDDFDERYNNTFPDAPGSPAWWARKGE